MGLKRRGKMQYGIYIGFQNEDIGNLPWKHWIQCTHQATSRDIHYFKPPKSSWCWYKFTCHYVPKLGFNPSSSYTRTCAFFLLQLLHHMTSIFTKVRAKAHRWNPSFVSIFHVLESSMIAPILSCNILLATSLCHLVQSSLLNKRNSELNCLRNRVLLVFIKQNVWK